VDPDLAASLDVTGDRDTGGLDLAARDPAWLDCLEAEVTEVDLGAPLGQPPHAAAVLLAVLDLLRAKHRWIPAAPAGHEGPAGPGLGEAVVDVGPERVQRDLALVVALTAAHLGAAEAAGAGDLDALGSRLDRGVDRLAHRPAEGHAGRQLLGHGLGQELGVQIGRLHLDD